MSKKATRTFVLAFHLYCENCTFKDFGKISNYGWQGGTYADVMRQHSGSGALSEKGEET